MESEAPSSAQMKNEWSYISSTPVWLQRVKRQL